MFRHFKITLLKTAKIERSQKNSRKIDIKVTESTNLGRSRWTDSSRNSITRAASFESGTEEAAT